MTDPARPDERLIASDRVEGTAVRNPEGEKLGDIERLLIDRASGQVEYAVLAFGGILGIGNRRFPLPWQALHYDRAQAAYVVDLTREQIEGAPSYEGAEPRYDLPYAQQLHAYYGLAYM